MSIHQISVFLENRTGQLAEITQLLANNHIDIRAISIAETADYGVARMMKGQQFIHGRQHQLGGHFCAVKAFQ